jgi:hypothetical protein
MQSPTIKPDELAEWLGYPSADAFQNARPRLVEIHGFPPKLPGKPVWSRRAVLQWIARKGGEEAVHEVAGNAVPNLKIEAGDGSGHGRMPTLEERYGGVQ